MKNTTEVNGLNEPAVLRLVRLPLLRAGGAPTGPCGLTVDLSFP